VACQEQQLAAIRETGTLVIEVYRRYKLTIRQRGEEVLLMRKLLPAAELWHGKSSETRWASMASLGQANEDRLMVLL